MPYMLIVLGGETQPLVSDCLDLKVSLSLYRFTSLYILLQSRTIVRIKLGQPDWKVAYSYVLLSKRFLFVTGRGLQPSVALINF